MDVGEVVVESFDVDTQAWCHQRMQQRQMMQGLQKVPSGDVDGAETGGSQTALEAGQQKLKPSS